MSVTQWKEMETKSLTSLLHVAFTVLVNRIVFSSYAKEDLQFFFSLLLFLKYI